MEPKTQIAISFLLSLGCIVILLSRFRTGWQQTTGLPLAFLLILGIAHTGAAIYLLPNYDPADDPYLKQAGVTAEATGDGMVATAVGVISFTLGVSLIGKNPRRRPSVPEAKSQYLIPRKLILFGLVFLMLSTILANIPSVMPLVFSAKFFLISGICLAFFIANKRDDRKQILFYGALMFALPMLTIGAFGFAALGVNLISLGIAFFVYRRKKGDGLLLLKAVPAVLLVFYIGSSVFVTYMQQRERIRSVVWQGSDIGDRVAVLVEAASNFEFFDFADSSQLYLIDARLNQSALTGRAIINHRSSTMDFEYGSTLMYATIAWIPRIIWWDKPVSGGSEFVTRHTGRIFAKGTTFTPGQVFELYVNFGYIGVIVGFVVIGYLVRWFDLRAAEHLASNDLPNFIHYHVIGMVLIQPMSFIFFLVTSVVGAYIVTTGFCRWIAKSR